MRKSSTYLWSNIYEQIISCCIKLFISRKLLIIVSFIPSKMGPIASSPAIDGFGNIYVTSLDGSMYVLSDATSSFIELWSFPTGSPIWASPTIGPNGTVYIAATGSQTEAGRLFSIQQATYSLTFATQLIAQPQRGTHRDIRMRPGKITMCVRWNQRDLHASCRWRTSLGSFTDAAAVFLEEIFQLFHN